MDRIFEAIETWMRDLLTGMVSSNLTTMYTDVNEKTDLISTARTIFMDIPYR